MAMSSLLRKSFGAISTPRSIQTRSHVVRRESFVIYNQYFSTLTCLKKLASYFIGQDFLTLERVPDRRLKPALSVHMPKPPAGFPFEIDDTPGEDNIKLTRELPQEKVFVQVDWKDNPYSSCLRRFQPYTEYASFRNLEFRFIVINSESNEPVIISGDPLLQLNLSGNHIKFDKKMDHDRMNYWQEVFPIVGIDSDVIRFLIVYMSKRNKLNRLTRLNKIKSLLSTIK